MLLDARRAVAARAQDTDPRRSRWPLRAGSDAQLVAGLALVAALLRFITLTHQSLWLDESQAVHEVRLSFGAMLHAWSTTEWNGPLYLLIAWPWAHLFGSGAFGLRALSAVLGVALIPLMYLAGRELVSRPAGLVAALLAALNPFMIWYSQEAREYMLLVVLCAASLWLFARAWRAPSGRTLAWWAVVSALALVTQYFAGFLVAAEGLALVYRARSRASVAALVAQAVVLAPLIPHVLPHVRRQADFIVGTALSVRLRQIPVSFGLFPVYQGSATRYGLLAAALLAALVIPLLLVGAEDRQLRGAGLAAGLAAAAIGVPLLLALVGADNVIPRSLMPAWPPLAVLVAAACAAPGARRAGAACALLLCAVFVYGYVRVNTDPDLQKPDVRAVASALGHADGPRAIVAYGGQFTTGPLSVLMPRVPWAGPGQATLAETPVTIDELDVVGAAGDSVSRPPASWTVIASREVARYQVVRLRMPAGWRGTPAAIYAKARSFVRPAPDSTGAPPVIFQSGSS